MDSEERKEIAPTNASKATMSIPKDMMQAMSAAIQAMMEPVMRNMAEILERTNRAMEQISAAQTAQSSRMEALEKQIRLQTPITAKQAQYISAAIRAKARELLDKRGLSGNAWAVKKLGNAIRRDVLARYGTGSLREIPKYEYQVAMNQIAIWMDALTIRDIAKEAREKEEAAP